MDSHGYGDLRDHSKKEIDPHKFPSDWIYYTTKYSFLIGAGVGFHRALFNEGTLNWKVHLREVLSHSVPFGAMGLSYTTCTFLLQSYNGKHRRLNHILGCLPAVGILHLRFKQPHVTVGTGLVMIFAAFVYAEGLMFNWPHVFQNGNRRGNFETLYWAPDLSLVKERKGWTY